MTVQFRSARVSFTGRGKEGRYRRIAMSTDFTFSPGGPLWGGRAAASPFARSGNPPERIPEIQALSSRQSRRVGRPSRVADIAVHVAAWLHEQPGLTVVEVLQRARDLGYQGGKTALYDLAHRLRTTAVRRRPDVAPGVYAVLEFGAADVRYAAGPTERVVFLVAELPWSRFVTVTLARRGAGDSLVGCVLEALETLGGAPLAAIWMSPRFVARAGKDGTIVWTPALARVALQAGFALRLEAARRPRAASMQQYSPRRIKAAVFSAHGLRDRAALQLRLTEWLGEVNRTRAGQAIASAAMRLHEDRARLRPLAGVSLDPRQFTDEARDRIPES